MFLSSRIGPIINNFYAFLLNEDLQRHEYCEEWKLKVNIPKTVYTIFKKSHKLAKTKVNITFQVNLIEPSVTLDIQMSLKEHTNKVKNKATKSESPEMTG